MNTLVYKWAALVLFVFIVCVQTQLLSIAFTFLVLGILPGTDFIVPSWAILITYPLLFIASLAWLNTQPLFIGETAQTTLKHVPKSKKLHSATSTKKKTSAATKKHVRVIV